MQQITSTVDLKEAIRQLEIKSNLEETCLKEDFQYALKSLNPFNILSDTIDRATSTPLLLDNIIGTLLGLATGFLSKKIIIGKTGNRLRVLFGSVIQYVVLNLISQRSNAIKSIGLHLVQSIFKNKKHNTG
jgi:hypothetical protein